MGHEAEELGVTPPSTNYATVSILLGEATGLPHEDRIYQATRTGMKKSIRSGDLRR